MDIDRAALMRLFLSDSEEDVGRLETQVLALEERPDDSPTIDAMFRLAHTLKGNASILALDGFARFAHTLEDLLHGVRTRQTPVTSELVTVLLRAIDALRGMLASLRAGEDENLAAYRPVEDELTGWTSKAKHEAAPARDAAGPPAPAEEARAPTIDDQWGPAVKIEMAKVDQLLDLASRALVVQGQMGVGLLAGATHTDLVELHQKGERLLLELQDWNGNQVVIQVADDGAGFNLSKIRTRARMLGRSNVDSLAVQDLHQLVFEAGFTTADKVTELSGRGVGMDVVRRNVEDLHGTVEIDSVEGTGTTVELRLPLSLSVIEGFWIDVAGTEYVLPLDDVIECLELTPYLRAVAEREGIINVHGQPIAYVDLRNLLDTARAAGSIAQIVVVRYRSSRVALGVGAILGERQTVIKPLGRLFRSVAGISGSTIRRDGGVAFVIDVARLLRTVARQGAAPAAGVLSETTAIRGPGEL